VDNIAPGVPTTFLVAYGSGGNQLSWDPCPDPDFQFFRIYRGSTPDFEPATTLLAHETASSSWLDSPCEGGWDVYYRVSAVDHAGNEGPATAPGVVTDAPSDRIPTALALRSAHPNPFNPRTRLDYAVPAPGGAVRLEIFDAAGRRVRVLVDRQRDPGTYEVEWNGRDGRGHTLASGVYLARLSLGGESATRKLVLMK
jgi:hypothetical protein